MFFKETGALKKILVSLAIQEGKLSTIVKSQNQTIDRLEKLMAAIDDLKAAGARNAASASAALQAAVKTITDSQAANGGAVSAADAEAVVTQLNATSDSLDKAAAAFTAEDPTPVSGASAS